MAPLSGTDDTPCSSNASINESLISTIGLNADAIGFNLFQQAYLKQIQVTFIQFFFKKFLFLLIVRFFNIDNLIIILYSKIHYSNWNLSGAKNSFTLFLSFRRIPFWYFGKKCKSASKERKRNFIDGNLQELKNQEVNNWNFCCSHCQIQFHDRILFQLHMGYHGFENPFQCNRCGEICKNAITFNLHLLEAKH